MQEQHTIVLASNQAQPLLIGWRRVFRHHINKGWAWFEATIVCTTFSLYYLHGNHLWCCWWENISKSSTEVRKINAAAFERMRLRPYNYVPCVQRQPGHLRWLRRNAQRSEQWCQNGEGPSRRVPDTSVRGSRSYHAETSPNQPVYIDVAQERSQVFWT